MKKTTNIVECWPPLVSHLKGSLAEYRQELSLTWGTLRPQLEAMEHLLGRVDQYEMTADRLNSLQSCFTEAAGELLFAPVARRKQAAPQQRALKALADLNKAMEFAVRGLPSAVWTTGEHLVQHIDTESRGGLRARWLRFDHKVRPLPIRSLVEWHLEQDELNRARLDGEFFLLLARSSLHLMGPWHVFRQRSLDLFEDGRETSGKWDRARRRWIRQKQRLIDTGENLLDRYKRWFEAAPQRLVDHVLARPKLPASREDGQRALREYHEYWGRQQQAVHAVLDLEVSLARLAERVAEAGTHALESLDEEHAALLGELDRALDWLRECQSAGRVDSWPISQASMLTAEDRSVQLVSEIAEIARAKLPQAIETVNPKGALPTWWRKPWRTQEPEAIFLRVLESAKQQTAVAGLEGAEAIHRSVFRELERAREVIAYAEEAAREEGADGPQIFAEGVDNVTTLLEYHRTHAVDVRPLAEQGLTRGIATGFLECYIALDQGRLGLITHLVQEASERGLKRVGRLALANTRRGFFAGLRHGRELWGRLLVALGLKSPSSTPATTTVRAARLTDALELELAEPDLPLLYRRLFRLQPVEDPRYLVGRNEELAGLIDARRVWTDGAPVSILIVGARGSGKTSLLNCGSRVAFDGLEITRTQFAERITSVEEIERFLHVALDIPASEDLADALAGSKRVIVIEELERTFLRRMNGFAAVEYLMHLIAHTWRDVLWVLSINEVAYRYLNRVVEFERFFTHSLNAMSVRIEDIRDAIMMRHNLSGYRLAYPPVPPVDSGVLSMRRSLGFERDPADSFFDALYEQSGGVFRSAYELWQHHVERIEGGVVYLRQPAEPNFGPLRDALSRNDCFTLQAILQHGGLTPEGLVEVFGESASQAENRTERLVMRGILEPDPIAPGFRVRPEAGRLVRDALHRRNL